VIDQNRGIRAMSKPTVDRMLAGFKSFKAMYYEQRPERVEDLVNMGQKPEVLLIACSDSRVDPAILTNAEPGEMFVGATLPTLSRPMSPMKTITGRRRRLNLRSATLRSRIS
tara:strand:- start:85 stop:420 length:336 start_codon:yes stop_codon:yes gene_type:complete